MGADALNGGPLLESANNGDRLALSAAGTWTAERAGELEGLDIDQHGISAYPEYVISSLGPTAATHEVPPKGGYLASEKASSKAPV